MDPKQQAAVNSFFVQAVRWHLQYLEGVITSEELASRIVTKFDFEVEHLEPAFISLTKGQE